MFVIASCNISQICGATRMSLNVRIEARDVAAEVEVGGNEPPLPLRDAVHDILHIICTASKAERLFGIVYDRLGAVNVVS